MATNKETHYSPWPWTRETVTACPGRMRGCAAQTALITKGPEWTARGAYPESMAGHKEQLRIGPTGKRILANTRMATAPSRVNAGPAYSPDRSGAPIKESRSMVAMTAPPWLVLAAS